MSSDPFLPETGSGGRINAAFVSAAARWAEGVGVAGFILHAMIAVWAYLVPVGFVWGGAGSLAIGAAVCGAAFGVGINRGTRGLAPLIVVSAGAAVLTALFLFREITPLLDPCGRESVDRPALCADTSLPFTLAFLLTLLAFVADVAIAFILAWYGYTLADNDFRARTGPNDFLADDPPAPAGTRRAGVQIDETPFRSVASNLRVIGRLWAFGVILFLVLLVTPACTALGASIGAGTAWIVQFIAWLNAHVQWILEIREARRNAHDMHLAVATSDDAVARRLLDRIIADYKRRGHCCAPPTSDEVAMCVDTTVDVESM